MIIKKVKHMETKIPYEKPLTEEVRLSAPVVLNQASNNVNEVFYLDYYGEWDEE